MYHTEMKEVSDILDFVDVHSKENNDHIDLIKVIEPPRKLFKQISKS